MANARIHGNGAVAAEADWRIGCGSMTSMEHRRRRPWPLDLIGTMQIERSPEVLSHQNIEGIHRLVVAQCLRLTACGISNALAPFVS